MLRAKGWELGFGVWGLICGFEMWCGVWGVEGVGLMIRGSGMRVGPDNPPSPAKATAGIQGSSVGVRSLEFVG